MDLLFVRGGPQSPFASCPQAGERQPVAASTGSLAVGRFEAQALIATMSFKVSVRVIFDRSVEPCWGARVGDDWAELCIWAGRAEPLQAVLLGRRALLAGGVPADAAIEFACSGSWVQPGAAAEHVARLERQWAEAAQEDAKEVEERDPCPLKESKTETAAPDAEPPTPKPESKAESGPSEAAARAEAAREVLGQSLLRSKRSRRGRTLPPTLSEEEQVREMVQIASARITLGGGAPDFGDLRCKLASYNYIRSTTGQREATDSIVEKVRQKLAVLSAR